MRKTTGRTPSNVPPLPYPTRYRSVPGWRRDLRASWVRACEWVGGIALGLAVLTFLAVTYRLGMLAHLVATGVIR